MYTFSANCVNRTPT